VIETNLTGMFLTIRSVLPVMQKQRRGDIITLSSMSGRKGIAYDSAYCASKFGVIGLSESLAEEARPYGIRVQAVLPERWIRRFWRRTARSSVPGHAHGGARRRFHRVPFGPARRHLAAQSVDRTVPCPALNDNPRSHT